MTMPQRTSTVEYTTDSHGHHQVNVNAMQRRHHARGIGVDRRVPAAHTHSTVHGQHLQTRVYKDRIEQSVKISVVWCASVHSYHCGPQPSLPQ